MKKELYIVTGAMGHVGNVLVQELVKRNKSVRGFALPTDFSVVFKSDLVEIVRGDLCDINSLERLFYATDEYDVTVVHAAGIVSISSKFDQKVYNVNVNGTMNLITMCKKYKVKKLIYISSVHAIPEKSKDEIITEISDFQPQAVHGLYAQTKAEATKLVLDACKEGLDACVVHPSGILGAFDYGKGHLTQLVIDYLNGSLAAGITGGYDFVDVKDVVAGILSAIENGKAGECYILSNQFYTIPQILTMLHEISGKRKICCFLPCWFAKWTAPLSELYYKWKKRPPLYTSYSIYTLTTNSIFSHEKATEQLNYHPRDIHETLEETVNWLQQNNRLRERSATAARKMG